MKKDDFPTLKKEIRHFEDYYNTTANPIIMLFHWDPFQKWCINHNFPKEAIEGIAFTGAILSCIGLMGAFFIMIDSHNFIPLLLCLLLTIIGPVLVTWLGSRFFFLIKVKMDIRHYKETHPEEDAPDNTPVFGLVSFPEIPMPFQESKELSAYCEIRTQLLKLYLASCIDLTRWADIQKIDTQIVTFLSTYMNTISFPEFEDVVEQMKDVLNTGTQYLQRQAQEIIDSTQREARANSSAISNYVTIN